jgi:hypothetical protein
MSSGTPSPEDERFREFLRQYEATVIHSLGFGVHGSVFVVERQRGSATIRSAVKFHRYWEPYCRERDAYLRLLDREIRNICGHAVPVLLSHDDGLWALEMTVVDRPFVLDFGGAYLDRPPDYGTEALQEWRIQKEEQFEKNWPKAAAILAELRRYGIFVSDVNPGNIGFLETDEPE